MSDWRLLQKPWLRKDLHIAPSFQTPSHLMVREPQSKRIFELDALTSALAKRANGQQTLSDILSAIQTARPADEDASAPDHDQETPFTPEGILAAMRWLDERMLLISPKLPHWLARNGALPQAVQVARYGLFEIAEIPANYTPADIQIRDDLRYACLSCGACCSGRYRVDLLPSDLERLEALPLTETLGLSLKDCLVPLPSDSRRADMALKRDEHAKCIFLLEGRWCALHKHFGYASKPYSCRSFPFDALMTPAGPLLRFRPECSSQHRTKASGPLVHGERFSLWAELTGEQPLLKAVPAIFPLNETKTLDYGQFLDLQRRWIDVTRAQGWRQGLLTIGADLMPQPTRAAPQRPFAVLAQHLLADLNQDIEPTSNTLDRLIDGAERDPLLWPTLLASVGVVLPEHQGLAEQVGPLLKGLRERLPALEAPDTEAQYRDYLVHVLVGQYLFCGLSALSGAGLVGLVLLGARHTAAWMGARYSLEVGPEVVNEALIFWHMLVFDERPLRAHLLLRAISGLETLPAVGLEVP